MYVYKITNTINNKLYIGITKNIKERWQYHKTKYKYKKEAHKPLYRAFRKYGIENFTFEILYENLSKEQAEDKEIELIATHKSLSHENGYNISAGGNLANIQGEQVNTAILTEDEVIDIITKRQQREKSRVVYKLYKDKIGLSGFQQIWRGKNWKHLQPEAKPTIIKGNARFSLKEVIKIKKKFKEGLSAMQVAKLFNIPYKTAYNIKTGISYSSIIV